MAVVKELLRTEADGTLSFGDYTLASRRRSWIISNLRAMLYKVKTFSTRSQN